MGTNICGKFSKLTMSCGHKLWMQALVIQCLVAPKSGLYLGKCTCECSAPASTHTNPNIDNIIYWFMIIIFYESICFHLALTQLHTHTSGVHLGCPLCCAKVPNCCSH